MVFQQKNLLNFYDDYKCTSKDGPPTLLRGRFLTLDRQNEPEPSNRFKLWVCQNFLNLLVILNMNFTNNFAPFSGSDFELPILFFHREWNIIEK